MSVGSEVLCRIAGPLAEESDAERRPHVADSARSFSQRSLSFVAREVRAAGAGAKRAAR